MNPFRENATWLIDFEILRLDVDGRIFKLPTWYYVHGEPLSGGVEVREESEA